MTDSSAQWPLAQAGSLAVSQATAPLWLGPYEVLQEGDLYWALAGSELIAAPRLEEGINRYDKVRSLRHAATAALRSLGPWRNQGTLELRYFRAEDPGLSRLRLLLLARTVGRRPETARRWAEQMLQAVRAALPRDYEFAPLLAPPPSVQPFQLVEVHRQEYILEPLAFVPAEYYYLVGQLGGDGSGWTTVGELLQGSAPGAGVSVVFQPTSLTELERLAVDEICTATRFYGEARQDYDVFGEPEMVPGDAGARETLACWEPFQVVQGVLVRVAAIGTPGGAHGVAAGFASAVAGTAFSAASQRQASYSLTSWSASEALRSSVGLGIIAPGPGNVEEHIRPATIQRLRYFFSEDDAAAFFTLPIPTDSGCAGFPESRHMTSGATPPKLDANASRTITLGGVIGDGSSVGLDVDQLVAHALIGGRTRSGKTTTLQTLLVELWTRFGVPWLVLDPKPIPEYRNLARIAGMESLRVHTLGNEAISPLRLNPLAIPAGQSVERHIALLVDAFCACLSLFDPLPYLLDEALHEMYDNRLNAPEEPWPTLHDLLREFDAVLPRYSYTGEARNLIPAFRLRFGRLTRGSAGSAICTAESSPWRSILSKPTVLELGGLGEDERNVITTFVLQQLSGYGRDRGVQRHLRHVVVIEEAHNLLSKIDSRHPDDPQPQAVERLVNAIAELGAVGQGFIIADQRPGALHPAVRANTATKIVHRQESADERRELLADIGATAAETGIAGQLQTGEAVVRLPDHHRPLFIQVKAGHGVDTLSSVSDEQVAAHMADDRLATLRLLPTALCTYAVCTNGCSPRRRQAATVIAQQARRREQLAPADVTGTLPDRYCTFIHDELLRGALAGSAAEIRLSLLRKVQGS